MKSGTPDVGRVLLGGIMAGAMINAAMLCPECSRITRKQELGP